jgi:hypothetical protein
MLGLVAVVISPLLFIVLVAWGILLLFVALQETVQIIRNLCDLKTLRRVTRFRVRTLLLIAAVMQVVFAAAAWNQQEGKPLAVLLFSVGCIAFFAWTLWAVFEETASQPGSRRWKRFIRDRHIVVPNDGGPPPPSQPGTRKTNR